MAEPTDQSLTIREPTMIFSCKGYNKGINLIKHSFDWNVVTGYSNTDIFSPGFFLGANSEFKAKFIAKIIATYPNYISSPVMTVKVCLEITKPVAGISHNLGFIAHLKCMPMIVKDTDKSAGLMNIGEETVTVLDKETQAPNQILTFHPTNPSKKVIIRCEILLLTGSNIASQTTNQPKLEDPPSQVLLESLASLYPSSLFTDIEFVIGDEKISAHKNILAARSVVFKAMFLNDMQESKSNIVNITDASVEGFREFVRFIYTGQGADLEKHGEELLCLAEKYALQDLKAVCEKSLMKSITVDNASRVLVLSDAHRATQLKVEAISFFLKHREAVRETEEWKRAQKEHSNIIAFLE